MHAIKIIIHVNGSHEQTKERWFGEEDDENTAASASGHEPPV